MIIAETATTPHTAQQSPRDFAGPTGAPGGQAGPEPREPVGQLSAEAFTGLGGYFGSRPEEQLRFLVDHLGSLSGKTLLDVGSGPGGLVLAAATADPHGDGRPSLAIGVEYYPELVRMAQELASYVELIPPALRATGSVNDWTGAVDQLKRQGVQGRRPPPNVEFRAADARHLAFLPDESMDIVHTDGAISSDLNRRHVADLLREMLRVVRDGGALRLDGFSHRQGVLDGVIEALNNAGQDVSYELLVN